MVEPPRLPADDRVEQAAPARVLAQEQAIRDDSAAVEALQRALAEAEAARQQRREALRQEALLQEQASRDELARQEAARRDAERVEAERLDALAREVARQEAALQQVARQEAALQEAARQERLQREQAEARALEQERARAHALEQAQAQATQTRIAQEAQREERLRAIGRQLDQEAAQRAAAIRTPGAAPPTVSGARRGWLLGRADPNAELVAYAQAMGRKIELNMTIDTLRELLKQPHRQPLVTIAVRSDGSVEKVTFVTSSGVPAIDAAIERIVAGQAPYGAFPPALARQYDVVEIRRAWIFDVAIRLE